MQRTQQQPIGLKYGYLFKCSQKLKSWENTWFVLGTQELTYYNRGAAKTIDLQQAVSIVAADVGDSKRAHSFKLTSPSFSRPLILATATSEQTDEWIAAIRAVASLYAPPPETPNGPPKLTPDNRKMLDCTLRIVQSAGKLVTAAAESSLPGVYHKLILDSLSMSALMCGTTGRVVVYKPKVQSGGQRFTQSVTETMALVVKYKHTYQAAKRKNVEITKGKSEDPLANVTSHLESLIEVIKRTVTDWMPNTLDPELTKPLDEPVIEDEEEKEDREEKEKTEKGEPASPYVTPFFINYAASPPPCKKHWDLLVDECQSMLANMENLGKANRSNLKQVSPIVMEQARSFLLLSRRLRETQSPPLPNEVIDNNGFTEDQFNLTKQQLLGSASAIDYQTANVGLAFNEGAPPQVVDVIAHCHGISSALAKLPRAIRKHRGKTLVSVVENIGSFAYSLSRLVSQMAEHENFARNPRAVSSLREELHAVQYLAIYLMSLCNVLVEGDYRVSDIIPFTDTAKLLALGVSNTLESLRNQLAPTQPTNNKDKIQTQQQQQGAKRKLASELTDSATGSMVFWFGLVGQKASVHL